MAYTVSGARDALVYVAKSYTDGLTGDALYSAVYSTLQYEVIWPTDDLQFNQIVVWSVGGVATRQGLGTEKRYRYARYRVDGFFNALDWADAALEQVRTAWINDTSYYLPNGTTPGQGYLRQQAGIKQIAEMTELSAAHIEKSRAWFRRFFQIVVEIDD